MFTTTQPRLITRLLSALLAGLFLLTACTPAVSTTSLPYPTATNLSIPTLAPTTTTAPVPTVVPTTDGSLQFSLDTSNIATGLSTETVAAVSSSDNAPYWQVLPEYTLETLSGYPIYSSRIKAQIFIYPVRELVQVNEGAGKVVGSLQLLLQSPQDIPNIPFLPLLNEQQVMHTRLQYLDFKNGQGLRYLTEFSQALVPINNAGMIYTYQGLTSDGKYYVAAVLPVNHPSLPVDEKDSAYIPLEFSSDYPAYLANVINTLNTADSNTFAPDLIQLDAMMSSMEIR